MMQVNGYASWCSHDRLFSLGHCTHLLASVAAGACAGQPSDARKSPCALAIHGMHNSPPWDAV